MDSGQPDGKLLTSRGDYVEMTYKIGEHDRILFKVEYKGETTYWIGAKDSFIEGVEQLLEDPDKILLVEPLDRHKRLYDDANTEEIVITTSLLVLAKL